MSDGYSDDFDELSTPEDSPRPAVSAKKSVPIASHDNDDDDDDHFSSYHTSAQTTPSKSATNSPRQGLAGVTGAAYPTESSESSGVHLPMLGGGVSGRRATAERNSIPKQDITAERLAAGGTNVKHAMHVSKVTTVQRLDEDDEEADYKHELSSKDDEDEEEEGKPAKVAQPSRQWAELGDSVDGASSVAEEIRAGRQSGPSTRATSGTLERQGSAGEKRVIPLSLQGPVHSVEVSHDDDGSEEKVTPPAKKEPLYVAYSNKSSVVDSSVVQSSHMASQNRSAEDHSSVKVASDRSSSSSSSSSSAKSSPEKPVAESSPARSSSSSSSSSSTATSSKSSVRETPSSAKPVGIAAKYPTEAPPPAASSEQRNSNSTSGGARRARRQVNAAAGATSKYDRFNGRYPNGSDSENGDDDSGSDAAVRRRTAAPATEKSAGDSHDRDALIARCVALRSEIEEWNSRIAQQEHEEKLLVRQRQKQQQQEQARRKKSAAGKGEDRETRLARLRKENAEMKSEVDSYEGNEIMSVAFLVARAQKQLAAAKNRLSEAQKVKRALTSRDKRAAHTIEEVHRRQPAADELEQRQVNEGLYSHASLDRQRRELKARIKKSEESRDVMQRQCEKLEKDVAAQKCADITPKDFEALQERYLQAQKATEKAKTAIAVYTNAINAAGGGGGAAAAAAATPRRRGSRAVSDVSGADEYSVDLLDAYTRQRQALETERAELLQKIEQREAIIAANTGGEVYTKPRPLPSPSARAAKGNKTAAAKGRAITPPSRHPSQRPSVVDGARTPSSAQAKLTGARRGTSKTNAAAGRLGADRRISGGGGVGSPSAGRGRGAAARSPTKQGLAQRRRSSNGRVAARSPQKNKKDPALSPTRAAAAAAGQPRRPSKQTPKSNSKLPELAPEDLAVAGGVGSLDVDHSSNHHGGGGDDIHVAAPPSNTYASEHVVSPSKTKDDSIDDVLRAIDEDNARLLNDLDKAKPAPKSNNAGINVRHHPFLSEEVEDEVDDLFGPTSTAPPALAKKADAALDAALDAHDDVVDDVAVIPVTNDDNDGNGDSGRDTPPWLR